MNWPAYSQAITVSEHPLVTHARTGVGSTLLAGYGGIRQGRQRGINMTDDQMDEIKRHFDVVAEGLHHELRLIVESNTKLERKVAEHCAETRQHKQELQAMIH